MAKRPYHHGNLRAALVEKSLDLVRSDGVEALTTRAAAKAAGVASSAVFRHFADRKALATAVAARGFEMMLTHIRREEAQAETPMAQFRAVGVGYLDFALTEPHLFRLMFRAEHLHADDPALLAASAPLNDVTASGLSGLGQPEGDLSVLGWAIAHGLATLALDSQLDQLLPADPQARRAALVGVLVRSAPAFAAPQA